MSVNGQPERATRTAFELFRGPVGRDEVVLPCPALASCVNPAHVRRTTVGARNRRNGMLGAAGRSQREVRP